MESGGIRFQKSNAYIISIVHQYHIYKIFIKSFFSSLLSLIKFRKNNTECSVKRTTVSIRVLSIVPFFFFPTTKCSYRKIFDCQNAHKLHLREHILTEQILTYIRTDILEKLTSTSMSLSKTLFHNTRYRSSTDERNYLPIDTIQKGVCRCELTL